MASLYELTQTYKMLMDMMEDPEIDGQAIIDTMESIGDEIEDKADGYAKIIRMLSGRRAEVREEIERLQARKNMLDYNIDRLKDNLEKSMRETGKTRFQTNLFSFRIQKNGGALPLIVDVDPEDLPDELMIVNVTADKKALAKALSADPEKYGKYGHFGERGESLRIS